MPRIPKEQLDEWRERSGRGRWVMVLYDDLLSVIDELEAYRDHPLFIVDEEGNVFPVREALKYALEFFEAMKKANVASLSRAPSEDARMEEIREAMEKAKDEHTRHYLLEDRDPGFLPDPPSRGFDLPELDFDARRPKPDDLAGLHDE